jgi:hypothetical protein
MTRPCRSSQVSGWLAADLSTSLLRHVCPATHHCPRSHCNQVRYQLKVTMGSDTTATSGACRGLSVGMSTLAITAGEPEPRISGAAVMPIFQSATFLFAGEQTYDSVRYTRCNNNPSQEVGSSSPIRQSNAAAAGLHSGVLMCIVSGPKSSVVPAASLRTAQPCTPQQLAMCT